MPLVPETRWVPLIVLVVAALGCDTGTDATCEPAASVSATYGENASLAIADEAGCRIETAGALAGLVDYPFGPERDYAVAPTFLVTLDGPINDGASVRLGFGGAEAPAPGRYPVTDLRGADGRFGPTPARFAPDAVYSFTTNGDGQGYWFATGGEVVVERSDGSGVSGTVEATYLHGGGGRPVTVRARFRAVLSTPNYGQFSNPHGG